jgi:hypothetical protein
MTVEHNEKVWKKFLRNHWKILIIFIIIAIVACVGAILVFLWFVGEAQITGLVPTTLNLWTMGYLITFLLHVIFWEILYIGIPVLVIVAIAWRFWWKKIPDDERKEYKRSHLFGKRSRRSDGGGAVSFLINIAFIIKIYYDGNWHVPFAEWTFDYLVYSYLWALIWIIIIIGIPMVIGGSWWILHEMKKKS